MMSHRFTPLPRADFEPVNEKGSALIICMMIIVVLSTIGIMAVQTSTVETRIAANEQRFEEDFNLSEGGAVVEAADVGHATPTNNPWYEISDPDLLNQPLVPPSSADYDPGSDITVGGSFPGDFEALPFDQQTTDKRYWPHGNLIQDPADNVFDYAYLVTYLGASTKGIKGYDASKFAAYQFRINGATQIEVEFGGLKIGPKI